MFYAMREYTKSQYLLFIKRNSLNINNMKSDKKYQEQSKHEQIAQNVILNKKLLASFEIYFTNTQLDDYNNKSLIHSV